MVRANLSRASLYCDYEGNSLTPYEFYLWFAPEDDDPNPLPPLPRPVIHFGISEQAADPECFLKGMDLMQIDDACADYIERAKAFYLSLPCDCKRRANQIKAAIECLELKRSDSENWTQQIYSI